MAKGGSSSQTASLVPRAPTSTGTASARAPPTAAGMRKRTSRSSTSTARQSTGAGGGLNFFTDDTPGLKLSPIVVVFMSLGFIGFVTVLHIIGKMRG